MKFSNSLMLSMLVCALSGCMAQTADEEGGYDSEETEIEGLTQGLSSVLLVGNIAGGRDEVVTFDSTNAYLGSTYQSEEFCNESLNRVLIQKMSLSTGTRTTLVQGTNLCSHAARSIRSDGTNAFYIRSAASTTIRRVPVAGGVDSLVVSEAATSLQVDGTNLYWTTATGIRKRAKAGGAITTLAPLPAGTSLTLLGVDSSFVYFDQASGSSNNQVHVIRRVPIAGGGASSIRTVTTGRAITGFALDTNNVYWTDRAWGNTLNGAIRRVSKTGTSFLTIHSSVTRDFHDVAVTSSKVYWVEQLNFDSRDPAVIRSRTAPTQATGMFADETAQRAGIASYSDLKINGTTMFWAEYPWSAARSVRKGNL